MAFSTENKSQESTGKRYVGVAPVQIIAVNPTKEELQEIYGRDDMSEPNYIYEKNETNAEKKVRIKFIIRTIPELCKGIDKISSVSYYISEKFAVSSTGKKKVIDKYGRTAWVTPEEFEKKAIPMYSNGPAKLDTNYRQSYKGEEEVVNFLKDLLLIPNASFIEDQSEASLKRCEANIENVEKLLQGDFSELKTIIKAAEGAVVQVLFGVRAGENGTLTQATFSQKVLRSFARDYTYLDKEVTRAKEFGAYGNTVFEIVPIKEYVIEPTNFDTSDAVFNTEEDNPLPW